MTLPAKSLQVLIDLKAELLSHEVVEPQAEVPILVAPKIKPKREPRPYTTIRHARTRGESWQRYKRTGGW